MDRRSSGILVTIAVLFVLTLTGCVGKSSSNPGDLAIQSVSLTPTGNFSIELGGTHLFSVSARNGLGQTVITPIHLSAACQPPQPCAPLAFADNGLACAGSWDSARNPVVCTPGVVGVAIVTATAGGVSSPPTTVYIHQHIDSIQVKSVTGAAGCVSQGTTGIYQATAFSNGSDITNSVGPINWVGNPSNVLTADANAAGLAPDQIQVTAKDPGITQLFASAAGVTSSPFHYSTCLVSYIRLQIQNGTGNSVTLAAGGTKTIIATAVDTLGAVLSRPPLTWTTSNPEVATVSNGTVSAKQNASAAAISASCTPPTCNIGVLPGLPIYASNGAIPSLQTPGFGAITVNVNNPKPPAFTAWTATTGCGNAFNCSSAMFSVTAGNTPIGATVTLPRTPNSMQFIPAGTRVYLGSDQGLMFVDVGSATVGTVSSASSPCNVILCGKVLAISQDGNRVVVADTVTNDQVYIYDNAHATNAAVNLLIPNATAAAFSPDGMKVFILSGDGRLFAQSTVDAVGSVVISDSATDVAFSADGSFAYVAGTPNGSVSGFATCNTQGVGGIAMPAPAKPVRLFPLPDTLHVVALDPPNIDIFEAPSNQTDLPVGQLVCNPPTVAFGSAVFSNLGLGAFTPAYMQVVGSSQAIVLAKNVPAVLVFDIAGGTTTPITLVSNGVPLAASSSPDGSQVFVAACEEFQDNNPTKACLVGSVHIVNPQNGGDIQQIPFTNVSTNNSMCTNQDPSLPPCLPNLIAVKPQ